MSERDRPVRKAVSRIEDQKEAFMMLGRDLFVARRELVELEKSIDEEREQIDAVVTEAGMPHENGQCDSVHARIRRLGQERDAARQELATAQHEYATLHKELADAKAEVESLKATNASVTEQRDNLRDEVERLRKQMREAGHVSLTWDDDVRKDAGQGGGVEIIKKGEFTGVRFYLYLPVTEQEECGPRQVQEGPFLHHEGDDDSSAVTFWGKGKLKDVLRKALQLLETYEHGLETYEHGKRGD